MGELIPNDEKQSIQPDPSKDSDQPDINQNESEIIPEDLHRVKKETDDNIADQKEKDEELVSVSDEKDVNIENLEAEKIETIPIETNIVKELVTEEKNFEKILEEFKKELQDQINTIKDNGQKADTIKILEEKIDKMNLDQDELKLRLEILEKEKSLEKSEADLK